MAVPLNLAASLLSYFLLLTLRHGCVLLMIEVSLWFCHAFPSVVASRIPAKAWDNRSDTVFIN